jgi:hypothetical protein
LRIEKDLLKKEEYLLINIDKVDKSMQSFASKLRMEYNELILELKTRVEEVYESS